MRLFGLTLAGLFAIAAVILLAILTLPPGPKLARYLPASYDDLKGWPPADWSASLAAAKQSCERLMKSDPLKPMGADPVFGAAGDWAAACRDLLAQDGEKADAQAWRAFFERRYRPVAVRGRRAKGLFTGYFEPEYKGSLRKGNGYRVPLYTRPGNLVMVDLGLFRPELEGERIAGQVEGGRLKPFPSRAEIEDGAILGQAQPIVWLKDPVDAFFLHIQGSGVIRLPDNTRMRVGYAGQNGRNYTPIGRVLVAQDAIDPDRISMRSIRQWLQENESLADQLMRMNESYVFFRQIEGEAPVGSEGVPLTAGHSLAVDRSVIPLGVPVWLQSEAPMPDSDDLRKIRRLMMAQDTGSAIKGAVRGDVFWGTGKKAGAVAGRMQSEGRYYVLIPRELWARSR